MRRGNLFILLIAVVMGGAAALMARNWLTAHAVVPDPTGTLVVAAGPLAFGAVLTRENTSEISWSAGRLPEGAFATKEDLLKEGRRAMLAPIGRDEPILKTKVTGPGQRASLSALLEDGMRAVTVRVDDVRGVAGFVLPGDRVDVVLIRSVPRPNSQAESISDVLLQHVKVLAVDQLINERQETPKIAQAVTLEVRTDQAQKVLLATNIGKLSLILRQTGENHSASVRRVTESDLGVAELMALERPSGAPAPPPQQGGGAVVEIVRGMRSEKYNVVRSN